MDQRYRELARIASRQHGVAHLDQAKEVGLSTATVYRLIDRGLLEAVGSHCLRIVGAPSSWRQDLRIGLLDLGDEAAVTTRTAARLMGFDRFRSDRCEFLVPRALRRRSTVGTVHSLATISNIDVTEVDGFRCTSGAMTVVELARTATFDELARATDSAIRDGWTSEAFLRKRLQELRHRGRDGVRLLDRVLVDAGGHSPIERRYLMLLRRAGLPKPNTQVIMRRDGVHVARVDCTWPDTPVIVELNGHKWHSTRWQLQRDEQRRTELTLMGRVVVAFTRSQLYDEPRWVVERTADLLRTLQAPNLSTGERKGA
jgi:very-short-patch-repair endonuclease